MDDLATAEAPGGKSAGLHWLISHGYRVPRGWALAPADAAADLLPLLDSNSRYAVRSSANLEDGSTRSFAGQFATELDVSSAEVPAALDRVRQSVANERVAAYLSEAGIDASKLRMGVIVQEMVAPVVSGVAFSRDPMTGLSETVIEAVPGRGDALVGEGHTPQRWVYRWGDQIDAPTDPILDAAVVESIVDEVTAIEGDFGRPVDLEWVWDGEDISWVQLREITGIDEVGIYSNRIAKEVLPGVIKPLVWSVNVPLVNSAWIDLFTEVIGPNDLEPNDLARSFGYRAYFNMGTIGRIFESLGMQRETLELLLGFEGSRQPTFKPSRATYRHLPRLLKAAVGKLRYGRKVEKLLPELDASFDAFADEQVEDMSDSELVADIDRLHAAVHRAAYANIVVPLLMNAYYGRLRKRLEKLDIDVREVDLSDERFRHFDPTVELRLLHDAFAVLPEAEQRQIASGGYGALGGDLRRRVDGFIERFGHFSESGSDFSVAPWHEDPDHVVEMIVSHRSADVERLSWQQASRRARMLGRASLNAWYRRARAFRSYRDAVSFEYTRGYGLFRERFVELGRRLAAREQLDDADDVWYLTYDELRRLTSGETVAAVELASARRAEIEEVQDNPMPDVIYGEVFVPPTAPEAIGDVLHGVPTSRGVYRGPARVVRSRADFGSVEDGDVLVIPFSDVGWTPLFGKAGAVVAESGGILSHSSIVAREYGIPCVVSVPNACSMADNTQVVVDGYRGTVTKEQ